MSAGELERKRGRLVSWTRAFVLFPPGVRAHREGARKETGLWRLPGRLRVAAGRVAPRAAGLRLGRYKVRGCCPRPGGSKQGLPKGAGGWLLC